MFPSVAENSVPLLTSGIARDAIGGRSVADRPRDQDAPCSYRHACPPAPVPSDTAAKAVSYLLSTAASIPARTHPAPTTHARTHTSVFYQTSDYTVAVSADRKIGPVTVDTFEQFIEKREVRRDELDRRLRRDQYAGVEEEGEGEAVVEEEGRVHDPPGAARLGVGDAPLLNDIAEHCTLQELQQRRAFLDLSARRTMRPSSTSCRRLGGSRRRRTRPWTSWSSRRACSDAEEKKSRRSGGHYVKAAGGAFEGAWWKIGGDGVIA
ncbi:hypothetical protein GLOTRDRAFT_134236 [Gloeophyllum trabeum ATCC 11539]|uniref:Uncharacterized protein n=1 Tax=Gloeophyllum trabeum (strain ATCC 11539 / FP-39264 / Madison 617) TaxID=670483 RepID=S7PQN2_GLOTA|nr:uncharacterized protein GLOTRDRAFT_134236 [Gloeophyllum trabeum ATCC 11539]EPQ50121.1 hypothetical protein GLOTRDRAFT_134236 [Gloeophyllum trabeum ATCC 11539]